MSNPRTLLGKSKTNGRDRSLPEHTRDVLRAVDALFRTKDRPSRLGLAWIRFFGIAEAEFDRFMRHLRIAAAFHDLGKANDGFQEMLVREGSQVLRHEHLSALLMAEASVTNWLREAHLDVDILLAAVVSHHLQAGTTGTNAVAQISGVRSVIRLYPDHEDFLAVRALIEETVGCTWPDNVVLPSIMKEHGITRRGEAVRTAMLKQKSRLRNDPDRRKLLQALRAGLIVADSVGSAITRLPDRMEPWIRDSFPDLLTTDYLDENILVPRINQLREAGRWDNEKGLSEFQRGVVHQGSRVLLTTPCGSGKTLAAWNWIREMASTRPAARVLFLYPTRATSTEGFRDYVSWAPESDAGLLTGTADFDLQDMFTAPDDPRSGRKYGGDPRLFALGLWRKRLFSATADQFFPFLQYAYGPICLLPVLVESIIVVDEIHSFDRSMFASLKRFLKEYPTVPVLCMTATIPGNRRDDLVNDCGLKAYPETTPADLQAIAQHPRYRVEWIERDKAMGIVRHAVEDRRRLLWVVNRVADCQSVFADVERLTRRDSSFCYHSRFRLMDRAKRHRELIHAFQDAGTGSISRPIVGVATQVCEMSLDIDADILITELAPISSLIQRMGRAARKWPLPKERVGRVYVIRPEAGREKPYEPRELKAATEFVERLVGDDLKSQHDLQAAYEACDPEQVEPDKLCPFLDSGPFAEAGSETFRDIEEFTTPCVLDEDLPAVLSALKDRQPYEGFIVPVPKKLVRDSARPGDSRFPRWLSVACASHYLTSTGFADEPQREEVKGDPT